MEQNSTNSPLPQNPQASASPEVPAVEAGKQSFLEKLVGKKVPGAETASTQAGNAFTKLFGAKNPNPVEQEQKAVDAQPKSGPRSIASLLGGRPTDKEAEGVANPTVAKAVFGFALAVSISIYAFFSTQLDPNFTLLTDYVGPNVALQFQTSNVELQSRQTELTMQRLRVARVWLDDVNSKMDSFFQAKSVMDSSFSTPEQITSAKSQATTLEEEIKSSLREVQKIFQQPLGVDTFSEMPVSAQEREQNYQNMLVQVLQNQRVALAGAVDKNADELRVIDAILNLAQNSSFRSLISSQDLGAITDEKFAELLSQIREQGTDELSMIHKLRTKRIDWGNIIQDITTVTRKADLYYGQGLFKTVGGFLFSSYRFDATTKRISISGVTKTSDSKTFSFIAQLVDSIEKSPKFKDIDFRSFTKSRDQTGDYSASVNLDFEIQEGPDSRDDIASPQTL